MTSYLSAKNFPNCFQWSKIFHFLRPVIYFLELGTYSLTTGFKFQDCPLNDKERLKYHQTHSQPVMEQLKAYISQQLDERRVKPNSELGKAMKYMLKHWHGLTQFLRIEGADLDNNIVERALKIAIRNRKSAMFYRTRYSAQIGSMLTSLIYTCQLAKQNPFDYLTCLQLHYPKVLASPHEWLPWNYQDTLKSTKADDASLQGVSPVLDPLVAA